MDGCNPEREPDLSRFLLAPLSPGLTVVVLGVLPPTEAARARERLGSTGLLVVCVPDARPGRDQAVVRGTAAAAPLLSHAADLVLVTEDIPVEFVTGVVAEVRRLLAPGGVLRATGSESAVLTLVDALPPAGFREVATVQTGSGVGVSARGPR